MDEKFAKDYIELQEREYVHKGISDLMKLPKLYPQDFGWGSPAKAPCILVLCKDGADVKRLDEVLVYPFENQLIFTTKMSGFIGEQPFAIFLSKNVSKDSELFKKALHRVRARCHNRIIGVPFSLPHPG